MYILQDENYELKPLCDIGPQPIDNLSPWHDVMLDIALYVKLQDSALWTKHANVTFAFLNTNACIID